MAKKSCVGDKVTFLAVVLLLSTIVGPVVQGALLPLQEHQNFPDKISLDQIIAHAEAYLQQQGNGDLPFRIRDSLTLVSPFLHRVQNEGTTFASAYSSREIDDFVLPPNWRAIPPSDRVSMNGVSAMSKSGTQDERARFSQLASLFYAFLTESNSEAAAIGQPEPFCLRNHYADMGNPGSQKANHAELKEFNQVILGARPALGNAPLPGDVVIIGTGRFPCNDCRTNLPALARENGVNVIQTWPRNEFNEIKEGQPGRNSGVMLINAIGDYVVYERTSYDDTVDEFCIRYSRVYGGANGGDEILGSQRMAFTDVPAEKPVVFSDGYAVRQGFESVEVEVQFENCAVYAVQYLIALEMPSQDTPRASQGLGGPKNLLVEEDCTVRFTVANPDIEIILTYQEVRQEDGWKRWVNAVRPQSSQTFEHLSAPDFAPEDDEPIPTDVRLQSGQCPVTEPDVVLYTSPPTLVLPTTALPMTPVPASTPAPVVTEPPPPPSVPEPETEPESESDYDYEAEQLPFRCFQELCICIQLVLLRPSATSLENCLSDECSGVPTLPVSNCV